MKDGLIEGTELGIVDGVLDGKTLGMPGGYIFFENDIVIGIFSSSSTIGISNSLFSHSLTQDSIATVSFSNI
jgi:hypothetical protein